MEAFIQRIVDEKAELDERANKLEDFIKTDRFNSLEQEMRNLMSDQLICMKNYSDILGKRLILLGI